LVTQVNKIKSTLNIILIKILLGFTNRPESQFQIGVNKFVIKRWNARGIHHFVWKPIPYINYSNIKIIGTSIYSRIWFNKFIRIASRLMMLLIMNKPSCCRSLLYCSTTERHTINKLSNGSLRAYLKQWTMLLLTQYAC